MRETTMSDHPELPTEPGAYHGSRHNSIFLLNREGNWFDVDGTPSDGHGNNPEDYLPLVRMVKP